MAAWLELLRPQCAPAQPATHWHCPGATHSPWWLQPPSHTGLEQSCARHPGAQLHVAGPVQLPWPAHGGDWPKQTGVAQSAPLQPGAHLHSPGAMHAPCMAQSCRQMGSSHACPFQPTSHAQPVAPQRPCPEQTRPSVCSIPAKSEGTWLGLGLGLGLG